MTTDHRDDPRSERDRINYGRWLFLVVAWDAVLPFVIVVTTVAVRAVFPKQDAIDVLMATILPILAFLIRVVAGTRHIEENHCSYRVRGNQLTVFYVGIFALMLFECLWITLHDLPPGPPAVRQGDALVWGGMLAVYLACMTVAMYPGRDPRRHDPV